MCPGILLYKIFLVNLFLKVKLLKLSNNKLFIFEPVKSNDLSFYIDLFNLTINHITTKMIISSIFTLPYKCNTGKVINNHYWTTKYYSLSPSYSELTIKDFKHRSKSFRLSFKRVVVNIKTGVNFNFIVKNTCPNNNGNYSFKWFSCL